MKKHLITAKFPSYPDTQAFERLCTALRKKVCRKTCTFWLESLKRRSLIKENQCVWGKNSLDKGGKREYIEMVFLQTAMARHSVN